MPFRAPVLYARRWPRASILSIFSSFSIPIYTQTIHFTIPHKRTTKWILTCNKIVTRNGKQEFGKMF